MNAEPIVYTESYVVAELVAERNFLREMLRLALERIGQQEAKS